MWVAHLKSISTYKNIIILTLVYFSFKLIFALIMTTQNMNLFEKHQQALNTAVKALGERTYFTPYPENPKAYAEDADAKAKAWISAAMNNDFKGLKQAGEIGWSGEEVSPFLQVPNFDRPLLE
jgi:hypothetical protein